MEGVTGDAAPPVSVSTGPVSTVSATLNYLRPGSKRNRLYVAPGGHMTTTEYAPTTVTIANARPHTAEFGLDRTGFTLLRHTSAVEDFGDPAQLDGTYRAEAGELVRQALGADEIVTLGWVIRRANQALDGAQPPASDVHVDIHPGRTHDRMSAASPRGEPYKRAVMTSLWRAFSPPPQDWPLALCDYRSVGPGEGLDNRLYFVDKIPGDLYAEMPADAPGTSGFEFHHNPGHQWWYFPGMTRDEVLFFKLNDSDHARAWRVPHSAFRDVTAGASEPRHSIEFRTIAYFE